MLLLAALSIAAGLTVCAVIHSAERLGGEVGGLLATAPVVSTFGLWVVLAHSPVPSAVPILAGNFSVLAALIGLSGYSFVVMKSGGGALFRLGAGSSAFFLIYVAAVWAAKSLLPLGSYLFALNFLIAGILAILFARTPVESNVIPGPFVKQRSAIASFLAGFLVVGATGLAARIEPVLGGVLAVFPGVFFTSLILIGVRQSPAMSVRAAQEGVPGIISILLFLLGFWLLLPLIGSHRLLGLSLATLLAWAQYLLGLALFSGLACPLRSCRCAAPSSQRRMGCSIFSWNPKKTTGDLPPQAQRGR